MDHDVPQLERTVEFQLLRCGIVTYLVNEAAAMSYPVAVIGHSRGGKCWVQIQGKPPQRLPDNFGYVIPPNVAIRSWSDGSALSTVRWSHVRFTLLGGVDLFQVMQFPLILPTETGKAIGAINAEQVSLREGAEPFGLAAMARRQELGFRLLGILMKHAQPHPGTAALLSGRARVQPALDYMQAHLAEPIQRDVLAACVHLSESRFHDVFRQATGTSAIAYLRRLRIRKAQELLLSSELSVADVGRRCGYPNQFHFSREFKNTSGQSPHRYRVLAAQAGVRGTSAIH